MTTAKELNSIISSIKGTLSLPLNINGIEHNDDLIVNAIADAIDKSALSQLFTVGINTGSTKHNLPI